MGDLSCGGVGVKNYVHGMKCGGAFIALAMLNLEEGRGGGGADLASLGIGLCGNSRLWNGCMRGRDGYGRDG